MASKFINVVSSAALAAGATIAVPHELNRDGVALTPHIYAASVGGFTVTVDATNVTFTNNTGAAATCTAYVRYDHSFQQVFGPAGTQTIAGLPFNIGGGGANVTLAQAYANGPAGGQAITLDATRDGVYLIEPGTFGIAANLLFAVVNNDVAHDLLAVIGGAANAANTRFVRTASLQVAAIVGSGVGGVQESLLVTGAANTTMTTTVEVTQARFNFAQTREWATGNFALQRTVRVDAETIGFVGASTITDAATFWVGTAPVAGANATLTRSWSAMFGGNVFMGTQAADAAHALYVYSTGDMNIRARSATAGGSAAVSVQNDGAAISGLSVYGTGVGGSSFGLLNASLTFLNSTLNMVIGSSSARSIVIGTNGVGRLGVEPDAEAANSTAVYISVNGVMKKILADTIANVTAAAGLALYTTP